MGRSTKAGRSPRKPAGVLRDHHRREPQWLRLLPLLVVAAGVVVYLNSFSGTFLFDDTYHIVKSAKIRSLWPPWALMATRRPVVTFTLAVNYALGGLEVWGYHAVNLAAHIFAALTLFGVVRRTLRGERFAGFCGPSAPWIALAVALIWVVHPLQTQSVTYIIQRGESFMGLFYLLTLYCFIRGLESESRRRWYAAAIVACALGMGSKAVMVTAPFALLLYDGVFVSRSPLQALRLRWGLYLGLAATWAILAANGVAKGVLNPPPTAPAAVGFGFKGITPSEYLMTQAGVILHYLRLSIWPHPLCLDPGWPVARTIAAILPPALVVGSLLAGAVWALYRRSWLGFVGAWFFLILAPTSSFIPIKDLVYEHRMYLSLAAVVVLAVIGGHLLLRQLVVRGSLSGSGRRLVAAGLTLTVTTVLGYGTIRRNQDYHSRIAMWSDLVAKRPNNARAYANLGLALLDEGQIDQAITACRQALQIDPEHRPAHLNLGLALVKRGGIDEAIECFRTALRLNPNSVKAYYNLGRALVDRGEIGEGIKAYREVLRRKPFFAEAHHNLGNALLRQGKIDDAIEAFRMARQSDPTFLGAYYNLGHALADRGNIDEAIQVYRDAVQVNPAFAEAHYNLGLLLQSQGKIGEAITAYRNALRIRPRHYHAYNSLGISLAMQGRTDEAIDAFRTALRINPASAPTRHNLGLAFLKQSRFDEAVQAFRDTLRISPTAAAVHYNLGRALAEQGRIDEAIKEYRETLRIDPGYVEARQALEAAQATLEHARPLRSP